MTPTRTCKKQNRNEGFYHENISCKWLFQKVSENLFRPWFESTDNFHIIVPYFKKLSKVGSYYGEIFPKKYSGSYYGDSTIF